jgi:hypothetical protein
MQLDKFDLNFCVNRLPKKLVEVVKSSKQKLFIGGGYIRGVIAQEKINDINLFVSTAEDAAVFAGLLSHTPKDIYKTENAYTIRAPLPLQIIHRWVFDKPEDVSLSFDFTVCCAVIWFENDVWHSFCDDRFYTDLASKRLVYRSPARNEDAGGSLLRVLKYYQRGYRIPLDSLGAVIARLMSAVKMDVIDSEETMARVITGLLREVDPNIDPNHISHLPSEKV